MKTDKEMTDHDNGYEHSERLNGVTAFVFRVENGGQKITVSGWHPNHYKFKSGERVMLIQESGEATRYRIKEVRRPGDPHDQYFMDLRILASQIRRCERMTKRIGQPWRMG